MMKITIQCSTCLVLLCALVRAAAVEIAEADHEERPHFVVRTEQATWWYDRAGGGFSRLIDRDGRDWIAFRAAPLAEYPASAAAGYRGIPNAVFRGPDKGAGHPGFDQCMSEKIAANKIRTASRSGNWAWTWAFGESAATFEMETADPEYKWWFLYEGPIAGTFEPTNKYWGTNRGGPHTEVPHNRSQKFDSWQWIYFGDRDVPRVLYLAQHKPDDLPDTLWYLGSTDGGSAEAPDGMVVFGFGRGPGTTPQLEGAGRRFTIGLLEKTADSATDLASIQQSIESVLRDESRTAE